MRGRTEYLKYLIEYLASVIEDDLPAIATKAKTLIKRAIEERLMTDPLRFGTPLRFSLKGYRRLRVGDCRVIFRIEEKRQVVLIVAVGHRKDVYEQGAKC